MGSTTQEPVTYDVCFVQTGDSSEEATETLKLAFEAMDSNQLEPVWITVSDCLKITQKEPKLFVVDPFEGVAFEHLKTLKCRIVGPLCVIYCLQYGDVLPKRSYPVYSVSMRKITVSCSNINAEMIDDISHRIQMMGGFFSKDFTKSVTHLVVGEVGSQKYKVAVKFGLPIMTPDWVTDVWENGQHKQLHASDNCYNKHKCPIFKGLIICVSQLSAEERFTLKKVIEENGGLYSGALKANETTHLVLSEPTGDKYRFAKNWKVICVTVKWIFDSVEAKYCQDETLYGLDDSHQIQTKRSTPKKDHTAIDLPLVDCSAIAGHSALSHLDETMKSDITLPVSKKPNSFAPLDELNMSTLPKYSQFLDGCKIFLTGFNPVHMDKLRKIVNSGGGMRFNKYSDSISHVVCGEFSDDVLQSLRSSSVKPFVVNYKWLLECCKNEKLIDEKPFLCMGVTALSPEKNEENEIKREISLRMSQNSSQVKKDDFTDDNMTDILKQYINDQQVEDDKENKGAKYENQNGWLTAKPSSGSTSKGRLSSFAPKPGDNAPAPILVVDLEPEPVAAPPNVKGADVENNLQADENGSISSSDNLFSGMKFVLFGFAEKDSEILSALIECHSGVVGSNQENMSCNLAVVPLIWYDLNIPVLNIVTNCWLQKCVEESRIFDFDENPLFRPFSLDLSKKPFESFVVSFSQYVGTERDCLIHLAETLGGNCQEYFVRRANAAKGVLANTHLVVSLPNGSKYEASKKWKIPAVTKQWVIEAAKLGIAPSVDNYLVDKFPELPLCNEDADQVPTVPAEIPKRKSVPDILKEQIVDLPHVPEEIPKKSLSQLQKEKSDDFSNIPEQISNKKSLSQLQKEHSDDFSNVPEQIPNKKSLSQVQRDQADDFSEFSEIIPKKLSVSRNQSEQRDLSNVSAEISKKKSISNIQREESGDLQNNCTSDASNRNVHEVSVNEMSFKSATENNSIKEGVGNKNTPKAENFAFPSATLQHSRITEICNKSRHESLSRASPIRPFTDSSLDVSLNLDASTNFKFHVSGILNDLDNSTSRVSIGGEKRRSLPVEEMFGRNLASALRRLDGKSNLDPENDSKISEDNSSQPEKLKVLDGVILYVSRKLSSLQIELNEIVVQLGGSYIWSYDKSCTHFVFVGKTNDIMKEFREARSHGKKIVCPEWVYGCKEKGCRVQEELYPHTYKANMTLSQQLSIQKVPSVSKPIPEVASSTDAANQQLPEENAANQQLPEEAATPKNVEVDFNKQLNELLVAAKSAKKRNSKRLTGSTSSSPVYDISPIPKYQRHMSDVYIKRPTPKDNVNEEPDAGSQFSQSYPIIWDDPTGRQEREKIAARAAKNAEELKANGNLPGKNEEIDLEVELLETPKPPVKKFMFSSMPDSVKAEYVDIIKKLGGEASEEKAFDITATHLILANPIKNEKFLSSVASGKWILHPLFLSASVEQNKFVDEEDYEWGGPSHEKFVKNVPEASAKIAVCAQRWRTKLQAGATSAGAFSNWKVVIHADDRTKFSTYMKILEAGGAETISAESADSALDRISHVFVDIKKRGPRTVDLSSYLSHNIKCVKPEYLAFYLIDDPPPDIDTYLVPGASGEFANSTSSKRRNLSTTSRQSKRSRLTK